MPAHFLRHHCLPVLIAVAGLAITCVSGVVAGARPAAAAAVDYTVADPAVKVLKTTASVSGSPAAQLMGARNEFVSFQIVLPGGSAGQTGMSVSPGTALTGPAGTIPNSSMTIYREDYYTTTQPSSGGRAVGAWPDVLIPTVDRLYGQRRNAFPVDVPAGQTRVAWVDILIPQNQAAGGYDGTILVTNGSGGSAAVPVHLDVRDFTLPATSSLRSLWGQSWIAPCDALYGSACNPFASAANEQRAWQTNYDFARLALDDRMTMAEMAFQPPANSGEVGYFNQYMLPLINGTAPTQLPGAQLTAVSVDAGYVSQWKSLAQSDGFTSRAVMYDAGNCDEPGSNSSKWNTCESVVRGYKSTWPGLPNVMTANIDEVNTFDPAFSTTDILTPVVDQIDGLAGTQYAGNQRPKYNTFLSNSGKQLWLYTSCDVSGCGGAGETDPYYQHPWADYTIDTQAPQNMAMGWLAYVYGASGELYYSTTQQLNTAWTNQWGFGGNGDGTLFYPGTTDRIGGTTPIPLESLRMKMIRDGYQDYEYLKLAASAGHGTQAMSIAQSLYPSTHDAGPSPAAIETARAQLADLIAPASNSLSYAAGKVSGPVTVDGQLGEYAGLPSIQIAGSNNTTGVRLGWDNQNLYAAYTVTDSVINVNQTGRDGELWNGDSVELMIDRNTARPAAPNANDYHLLVNTDNALTDEKGNGTGWDRSWTANATTAVLKNSSGYTVEIAVPWASIGGLPQPGTSLGLDVANNDSDTPGQVTPYDWANLTRFAQPQAWGTLTLSN